MELIRSLSNLNKEDSFIAGGKGASLGEMFQVNIPVPDGFVILTNSFESFLAETDIGVEIDAILKTVNKDEMRSIEHAAEKIQSLIIRAEIPENIKTSILDFYKHLDTKYVAVRSSATAEDSSSAAWAGQLESFLNTTEKDLLDKVKYCWASLFTPRAIFYRFEKELHATKISVAVVVQKMVNSEISGIAFSVHPVTEDRNQIIIEAGLGLGEAIVSGSITPDSYVIRKDTREIIDVNVSNQRKSLYRIDGGGNEWQNLPETQGSAQVLSESQIQELSRIIIAIENHYGFPCDIEWAFENGKFYIVQSRPITTLDVYESVLDKTRPDLNNYIRLFAFDGSIPFLFSYQFTEAADWLNYLAFGNENSWISYMDKNSVERANKEGLELYSSIENYNNFSNGLYKTNESLRELTTKIEQDQKISQSQLEEFFKLLTEYRWHYTRTEFFFTDLAFEKRNEFTEINKNFETFEKLKLDGRQYLNEIFLVPDACLFRVLDVLGNQFSLTVSQLNNYSPVEMKELFVGKKVSNKLIDDRMTHVHHMKEGGLISLSGSNAMSFIEHLKGSSDTGSRICGKTAYGGKVKARARVITIDIKDYDKVHKFVDDMQDGEVLVAETTEPSIILACKKASAIVTNQGGMMSHAAITAREMKIPCVVGTYVATEKIKTGDLVEVDADNGIINIIEKGK